MSRFRQSPGYVTRADKRVSMNNRFSTSVHNRWFVSHLEEMHCAFIIFVLCDELCGSCSWLLDMRAQFKANLRMWLCLLSRSWNWSFHLAGCPAHHLHDHPGRQLVHHQRRLGQSSSDGLQFSRIFAQLFSRIFHLAQLFPGDEHGQLHDVDRGQRLHEQLWSDKQLRQQLRIQSGWMGSTIEYVSIAMGYFDFFTISPDQECRQSSNARWARPLLRSAMRRPQIQTGTKSQRIAAMSPSGMNRCGGY